MHVHHAFLCISLRSLHDYDMKMSKSTFYGGRKQETSFSSNSSAVPKESIGGDLPTLYIFSNLEYKRDKV